MAFYFSLSKSNTSMVNEVLAKQPGFAPLGHRQMEGYLTGFVDLIFCFKEQFYILDYKTNMLGENYGDYSHDNLLSCMGSHNYSLQYWIYSLVLQRHLSRWYPGYTYESNFGGVIYLFVRGMSPDRPLNGVYYTRPDQDVLAELDSCLGG